MKIFVRNRARYSLNGKKRDLPSITIEHGHYARTFIADIKESLKRQGVLKVDELFLLVKEDGQSVAKPLEDGRTVAHYKIGDNEILETCSNPFFVTAMYILKAESELLKGVHEANGDQKMSFKLNQSVIHKSTIIQVLFNSSKEFEDHQPQHVSTVDEFVEFIKRHPKKGAEMSGITVGHLWTLYREHIDMDAATPDPIDSLVQRYREKLAEVVKDDDDDEEEPAPKQKKRKRPQNDAPRPRKKPAAAVQECSNCGENAATVYCPECEGGNGMVLCHDCSTFMHRRRQHDVKDIKEAPKQPKLYVPQPYRAPFAILAALSAGSVQDNLHSMTEDELRQRGQALTDTDLSDKTPGKMFGGFDSIESLMTKQLVRREATTPYTYTLLEKGHEIGRQLLKFHQAILNFCFNHGVPSKPGDEELRQFLTLNDSEICLIVDDREKSGPRMLTFARQMRMNAERRKLAAGDYMWVLQNKSGAQEQEIVLPITVERKSWDDLSSSIQQGRMARQMNNMLKTGFSRKFLLIEGSIQDMVSKPTEERKQQLKVHLEEFQLYEGFHVVYTPSWYKSAHWLLQLSYIIGQYIRREGFGHLPSYTEFTRFIYKRSGTNTFLYQPPVTHVWKAEDMVDMIFGFNPTKQQEVFCRCNESLKSPSKRDRHLLVLQGMEEYNKTRQKNLNTALNRVMASTGRLVKDVVEEHLSGALHQLIHYDVQSYWITTMQVFLGVHVVRADQKEDAERMTRSFMQVDPIDRDTEKYVAGVNNLPKKHPIPAALGAPPEQQNENDRRQYEGNPAQHMEAPEDDDWALKQAIAMSLRDVDATRETQNSVGKTIGTVQIAATPIQNYNQEEHHRTGDRGRVKQLKTNDQLDDFQKVRQIWSQRDIGSSSQQIESDFGMNENEPKRNEVVDTNSLKCEENDVQSFQSEEEQLKYILELSRKEYKQSNIVGLQESVRNVDEVKMKIEENADEVFARRLQEEENASHGTAPINLLEGVTVKVEKESDKNSGLIEGVSVKVEDERNNFRRCDRNDNDVVVSDEDLARKLQEEETKQRIKKEKADEEIARRLQEEVENEEKGNGRYASLPMNDDDDTVKLDEEFACKLQQEMSSVEKVHEDEELARRLQAEEREEGRDYVEKDAGCYVLGDTLGNTGRKNGDEIDLTNNWFELERRRKNPATFGAGSNIGSPWKSNVPENLGRPTSPWKPQISSLVGQNSSSSSSSQFCNSSYSSSTSFSAPHAACKENDPAALAPLPDNNEDGPPPQQQQQHQVKCGNCGNMGHNRKFKHCPNYWTEAETERRRIQSDTQKQKRETEQRAKQETVDSLREQQQALEQAFTDEERKLQEKRDTLLGGITRIIQQVEKKPRKKKK